MAPSITAATTPNTPQRQSEILSPTKGVLLYHARIGEIRNGPRERATPKEITVYKP